MTSRPTVQLPSSPPSNEQSISYTSSFEPPVTSPRLAAQPGGTFESYGVIEDGLAGPSKRRGLSPSRSAGKVQGLGSPIGVATTGLSNGIKTRGGPKSKGPPNGTSPVTPKLGSSRTVGMESELDSPASLDAHHIPISNSLSLDYTRGRTLPTNIDTTAEYHSSTLTPQSPIGVHNVNISINGVPYGVPGPGPSTTALIRETSSPFLTATRMAEEDFSPISTTFPSRLNGRRGRADEPTLGSAFPRTVVSAGQNARRSAQSFMTNPLALPMSRPYLRGMSTLILWTVALYAASRVLLPAHIHDSLQSSIASFTPFSSANSLDPDPTAFSSSSYQLSPHFPAPPARPGDSHASPDERYRAYKPLDTPPSPFPRLRKTKMLPRKCLEGWLLNGEMMCSRQELGQEEVLDVTWLWVNGSDSRWQQGLHKWREGQGVISPDHHFRENNELRYSIRSVLAALPGHLRTFHLILADYAFDSEKDMTLIPQAAVKELEASAARAPTGGDRWTKSGKAPTDKADEDALAKRGSSWSRRAGGPMPSGQPGMITVDIKKGAEADHLIHAGSADSNRRGQALRAPSVSDRLKDWLNGAWRVVQTPIWLNFEMMDLSRPTHPLHKLYAPHIATTSRTHVTSHPSLRYASHWEIFHIPTHYKKKGAPSEAMGAEGWREKNWKEQALPTYNSMAIESRIGWLWGLADVSLSMNDDFFLLREHAVSDFFSPLYGTVIRFDSNFNAQVRPVLDKNQITDPGESGGLFHANWLLSQRFPRRLRPYFAHVPKVITRGLHHEASIMFESALTKSSTRKFREVRTGDGDVQMQWLLTSLRVERWREALLWTWIVARVGTAPQWMAEERGELYDGPLDFWGDDARADVRALFGLSENDEDVVKVEVHRGERWTLEQDRVNNVFANANWDAPKATEMLFSSLDGHMPPLVKNGLFGKDTDDKCLFDLDRCFGSFWSRNEQVSADEMFKRLTFVNPACGDCLIMALVTSSGPLGLSAVFPPETATYRHSAEVTRHTDGYLPPPHLPMTPTWAEADFSLENVIAETSLPGEVMDLRLWSMQLLSRYLYMSGTSNSHFHMLVSETHADGVFKLLDNHRDVSILGMNDDIATGYDATRELMLRWFESRWHKPAVWEKGWSLEIEQASNDLL